MKKDRKMWWRIGSPLVALVVCAYAQNSAGTSGPQQTLTGEHGVWTKTTSGSFPCQARGRVLVSAFGDLTVKGEARQDCYYRIQQRVTAANAKRAGEQMQAFHIENQLAGDAVSFRVTPVTAGLDVLEVDLLVPKTSREVVAASAIGSVRAFDLDGAARIESAAGNLEADRVNGPAVCRTEGGNIRVGRVGGTLRCYSGGGQIRVDQAGGETWADTAGGEIYVAEVRGPLHASTTGGNIEVERALSMVRAFSMLGLIEIQKAGGLVTAETRGGGIQVGSSKGARCEAGAGTIRVRNSDGPIRLNTMAGNILAELVAGRPMTESILSTRAGDITVLIPSNLAVTIEARNETLSMGGGRILTDFPQVQLKPFQPGRDPKVATGALNGGGPLLRIVDSGGNIYLKRLRQ